MKQVWLYSKNLLKKIQRFFDQSAKPDARNSSRHGLAQFILLLSLCPFIFSLTLFDFHSYADVASKYQFPPDRFEGLSYEAFTAKTLDRPSQPQVRISDKNRKLIIALAKKTPERICNLKPRKLNPFELATKPEFAMRIKLNSQCIRYQAEYLAYRARLAAYDSVNKANKNEDERLNKQADGFISNSHLKPPVPNIEIIETSNQQFQQLLKQISLDDTLLLNDEGEVFSNSDQINNELSDDNTFQDINIWQSLRNKLLNTNSFQMLTLPAWLLAFLMIIPSVVYCIRRSAWGLLIFGLSVPSVYYANYVISFFLGQLSPTILEFTPTIFAQIALVWFLIKGSMLSRSFLLFIGLLVISTLLPWLLKGADNDAYSVIQAQVPILIFLILAGIGRLLIKGAKENFSLLSRLGVARNFTSALHALLLWLPMAILCLPFFYLSKVLVPTEVTNNLYKAKVLQFDSSHPQGFLDNSLQSLAHISDDINFAWHLMLEEKKAHLYASNDALQDLDFEQTLDKHYNRIIPPSLVFEEPNSGVPMVGFLLDLGTKETQKSIDKTYKKLRGDIRKELIQLVAERERVLKNKAEDGKEALIEELEIIKGEGKILIATSSSAAQTNVWWTLTYLQATHQLALLFFIFICIKSYLYVFSRVIFNKDNGASVSLGLAKCSMDDSDSVHLVHQEVSNIISTGIDFTIEANQSQTYYITRRYQCRGKAPRLSIPQVFSTPLARIFSKAYTMNKVVVAKGDADISCTATKGVEFFEWDLAVDETVVFNYENFVGMSEGLNLSTLISPRISSLLLGRMLYSQATGPGKLILVASGRAQICRSNEKVGSMPPERIIAMQLDSVLHVESELDFLNVYLSSAYVSPVSGNMIVDVDNQLGAKNGLVRFLRNFILPG